jgi:diguanylate cyclase (GGDEF)-like protein
MLALMAGVGVALLATEGLQLWRVYQDNLRQADVVSANTARSLAEQTEATLKTADTIAASLVERVQADGMAPAARLRLYGLMTSLAAALPAIHEMGITDSQGNAIVKSLVPDPAGLNYATREYFQFHATHPGRGAFIGARIQSKIDHTYNITVTHRIDRADGGFDGVVVTSVSLDYFQSLFDQIQAKSGGVIALVAEDGTVLVRSPPSNDARQLKTDGVLWQQMRDRQGLGNVTYASAIDGARRRGSYHHLSQYPVDILVSQAVWDLQTGFRDELRTHAVILGCFIVVVAILGDRALKASDMLNAQAMHDSLTGLANRRCFDLTIEREFRRAARSGQPISVVMIDLDHFKAYNDLYGHPAGDECLRAVGRAVQGCLRRSGEFAARYGGEEIAVVLPGYDAPTGYEAAEKIRIAVCGLALPHENNAHGIVTLSAGVATCMHGGRPVGYEALIREADEALYTAKRSGRDVVIAYRTSSPPVQTERARESILAGLP